MEATDDLYCDGGTAADNPSRIGGAWAYRVVRGCEIVRQESGGYSPREIESPAVTGDMAELLAAVLALADTPPGWRGTIWTDSEVTARRLSHRGSRRDTPWWLWRELYALLRDRHRAAKRGDRTWRVGLVAAHPTRAELSRGHRERGRLLLPVSVHNVWCDGACRRECRLLIENGG